MDHTQNYQLSRWAKDDRIMMEDFNADNEKIDAALKANADAVSAEADARQGAVSALQTALGTGGRNCRVAFGTYTGDGTYGESTPNSLTFDFCPMLVLIGSDTNAHRYTNPTVLLRGRSKATPDCGSTSGNGLSLSSVLNLTWTDCGVSWYSSSAEYQDNASGNVYAYVVLGFDNPTAT